MMQSTTYNLQPTTHKETGAREEQDQQRRLIERFLEVLAVAHTVVAEKEFDENSGARLGLRYNAESPDEGALVKAAARLGWRFVGTTNNVVEVEVDGTLAGAGDGGEGDGGEGDEGKSSKNNSSKNNNTGDNADRVKRRYRVLAVNEFNSTRKRMSVVVERLSDLPVNATASGEDEEKKRDEDRVAILLCKGADNVMLERAGEEATPGAHAELKDDLKRFATDGGLGWRKGREGRGVARHPRLSKAEQSRRVKGGARGSLTLPTHPHRHRHRHRHRHLHRHPQVCERSSSALASCAAPSSRPSSATTRRRARASRGARRRWRQLRSGQSKGL